MNMVAQNWQTLARSQLYSFDSATAFCEIIKNKNHMLESFFNRLEPIRECINRNFDFFLSFFFKKSSLYH